MNCKQCNMELVGGSKFCGKCGKLVEVIDLSQIDVEKLKKSIRNTGNSVYAIGWLTVIIDTVIYIWSLVDKNFSETGLPVGDFSGLFLIVVASSIFIILGNRIKKLVDKNIKTYLQILLGLSVLLFIWIITSGGHVGIIFFLIIAYLISSLFTIRKLMKVEEFTSTLITPKYILNKKGWTAFFAIAFLVFFFATVPIDSFIRNILSKEKSVTLLKKEEWSIYTSAEDKFSILLPEEDATLNSWSASIPNTYLTMHTDNYFAGTPDGTTYSVSVSAPLGVTDNRSYTDFDNELNIMLGSDPTNKIINSSMTIFDRKSALDYLIKYEREDFFVRGKLILDGTKVYNLSVAYNDQDYNESNYNKFISSFKIF